MAWVAVDYDGTLVDRAPSEDGATQEMYAVQGAVEAMNELVSQGHRVTIFTARLKPMPDPMRHKLAEEILAEARSLGFPIMEVWEGTTKPPADIFIDNNAVNFDGDWPLAIAQTTTMLQDRGLLPLQQPAPAGEEPVP